MGVAAVALPLVPAGCGQPQTGPVPVRFDRDSCELCRMLISDPRFAAEVRGGPGREIYKFDDIGDAINWVARQPWAVEQRAEIWVMSYEDGETWLDARKARYRTGVRSPMDYGYAAVPGGPAEAVDFETMKTAVLERGSAYCILEEPLTTDI